MAVDFSAALEAIRLTKGVLNRSRSLRLNASRILQEDHAVEMQLKLGRFNSHWSTRLHCEGGANKTEHLIQASAAAQNKGTQPTVARDFGR